MPDLSGLVLGYAAHTPDQLREAARRITGVLRAFMPPAQSVAKVTGAITR